MSKMTNLTTVPLGSIGPTGGGFMASRLPAPTDLSPLIAQVDALRMELGYSRFSHLSAWCDDGSPMTCDGPALERLYERLCILWAER